MSRQWLVAFTGALCRAALDLPLSLDVEQEPVLSSSPILVKDVGGSNPPPFTVRQPGSGEATHATIVDVEGREAVFRGVNAGVEFWKNDGRPWKPEEYLRGPNIL